MNKELILLPSVTYAMKAKSRTPKNTGIKSCGYCLFVPGKADEAERILRKNGIRVLGRAAGEGL